MQLLKADDLSVLHRAAAQARAAAVITERDRQAALAEAYARGFDAGRVRAAADGVAAAERGAAALQELVSQACRVHAEQVEATSRTMLDAALEIASWVLREEVGDGGRALVARLQECLADLLPSPTVRVAVCPGDAGAVRDWAQRHPSVQVIVEEHLSPGDAGIETDAGRVDVSVAAALRVAAECLGLTP